MSVDSVCHNPCVEVRGQSWVWVPNFHLVWGRGSLLFTGAHASSIGLQTALNFPSLLPPSSLENQDTVSTPPSSQESCNIVSAPPSSLESCNIVSAPPSSQENCNIVSTPPSSQITATLYLLPPSQENRDTMLVSFSVGFGDLSTVLTPTQQSYHPPSWAITLALESETL